MIRTARTSVLTGRRIAFGIGIAVLAGKAVRTDARVAQFTVDAHAAIVAWRRFAKVDLQFAVTSHETRFAVAAVVVDQLDAVERSSRRTRIRQAFVDVALASGTDETGRTLAFEGSYFVDASAAMMTSTFETFVDIDFAKNAERAVRTRAGKGIDQVVTHASILTRIRVAVVDVVLAVGALEAGRASARMRADQIFARGSVLARSRIAFVDLVLTITSRISCTILQNIFINNSFN